MAKCTLDIDDPNFVVLGNASEADLRAGLEELRDKLAKNHNLSGFFNHPMRNYPEYHNKIWKWHFAPRGDTTSTRPGWRLLAYVPNPNGPEPILARAFVCYDKSEEPKGDPAKTLAKALQKFLSDTKPVEQTEDRFRRQTHPDGRTISACYTCYEIIFSANDEEADIAEGVHECPSA